ncbi:MAG: methyltransferase [Pedobacter sp.]
MAYSDEKACGGEQESNYLLVDEFIADMVSARALSSAFEMGVIDLFLKNGQMSAILLQQRITFEPTSMKLFLDLLEHAGVVASGDGGYTLTPRFMEALTYRDLLVAKLDFAHIAAHDFIDLFSFMISDVRAFRKRAGIFRMFNYSNCLVQTAENYQRTMKWMRITTVLTRYEARPCFARHSLLNYRNMLDVGGNSGEFALQACRNHPDLRVTVYDLPVVCDVGQQHLSKEPEAERITFVLGNMLTDLLPMGFDIVTFKSVLHDWPEKDVTLFLDKAYQALQPGGTILIFERGPLKTGAAGLPYSLIPMALFSHTFRSPEFYCDYLLSKGFSMISVQWVHLDMPFFLITAVKKTTCREDIADG